MMMVIYLKPLWTVIKLLHFCRSRTGHTVRTWQFLTYNGLASEPRYSGQHLLALCGARAREGLGAQGVCSEPRLRCPRMMQQGEALLETPGIRHLFDRE